MPQLDLLEFRSPIEMDAQGYQSIDYAFLKNRKMPENTQNRKESNYRTLKYRGIANKYANDTLQDERISPYAKKYEKNVVEEEIVRIEERKEFDKCIETEPIEIFFDHLVDKPIHEQPDGLEIRFSNSKVEENIVFERRGWRW